MLRSRAHLQAGRRAHHLDRYDEWKAPARLVINVERAYREFRDEQTDAPWDLPKIFDGMYHLARARGLALEF
jgi:cyclase